MRHIRSTEFKFRTVLLGSLLAGLLAQTATGQGRRARPITALKVGVVHTVSGEDIQNGVILYRSGRILAVGKATEVKIPEGAKVLDYPQGHAYPGLVDALTDAYAPQKDLSSASVDAGTDFADALDRQDEAARDLIRYGVTTAYVRNRSSATWRGLGAIVKPTASGFTTIRNKKHGGVSLRMTTGTRAGHALDRLKTFDSTGNVFDTLEAYEKKQKAYADALEKYEKDYEAYLAHFAKNKGRSKKPAAKPTGKGGAPAKPGEAPAKTKTGEAPARAGRPGGTNGRRRGEGPGTGRTGNGRAGAGRAAASRTGSPRGTGRTSGKGAAAASKSSKGSKSDAPKKPEYPKAVPKDPAKEALLKVVAGKLPLRIEVHREDEIRAALFMAMLKELPGITLEFASDAGPIAKEVAEAGAPVVVTSLLSTADDIENERDRSALPAQLHAAGVAVAIGSGLVSQARNLTLMAAYACGRGLPEDAAIKALTLTPAKILGIGDTVGSLEPRKRADILITSGPLLNSDTRILRVIAQGVSEFEAK